MRVLSSRASWQEFSALRGILGEVLPWTHIMGYSVDSFRPIIGSVAEAVDEARAGRDDMDQNETIQFSKVRVLAERFEQAWNAQQDSSSGIDLTPFLPDAKDPARLPSLFELIKT